MNDDRHNGWAIIKAKWHYFITGRSLCKKHKLLLINQNPPENWSKYDGSDYEKNCKACNQAVKDLFHLKPKY